jgi:RecB family endonuclease NucS
MFYESDLEEHIQKDGYVCINGEDISIVGRQVYIGSYKIDLVGEDDDGNLYILELKKNKIDGNSLSQLLNYMDYVKLFFSKLKVDKKIFGVLIGNGITDYMQSSLKMLDNIFFIQATPSFDLEEQSYSFTQSYLDGDKFKSDLDTFEMFLSDYTSISLIHPDERGD